jgi:putative chitobiose transport system permease protein
VTARRPWLQWGWRYAALALMLLLTLGPFLWLLSTSLKGAGENIYAFPPSLLPQAPTLANYAQVLTTQPFGTYLLNSLWVAALAVVFNVLLASLAAYPLARMPFKGRGLVFGVLLATMMVPFQLLMIPVYELAVALRLQNTSLGLVLPHLCTGFGIFFMRQAFLSVPPALEEVALLEGVGRLQLWWHVMLPLVRPSLATLAVFSFVAVWGDFLWPLVLTDDPAKFTLPLGVNRLASTFSMDWRLVAAGAVFSLLPILVVFVFSQRFFIEGAMKGAVKG